ncbi:hypothetical protein EK21DRAFT_112817 [Setomelanomma holmii]|uniref:Uncharacterized protein n=1 Tax=Setomelanomma holmii TaxID=210430 RepID=A0A9P4H7E3_9PLEO|nr:hypothetical protein EK21DRAFT_112817 [Setomelanomma holmii]
MDSGLSQRPYEGSWMHAPIDVLDLANDVGNKHSRFEQDDPSYGLVEWSMFPEMPLLQTRAMLEPLKYYHCSLNEALTWEEGLKAIDDYDWSSLKETRYDEQVIETEPKCFTADETTSHDVRSANYIKAPHEDIAQPVRDNTTTSVSDTVSPPWIQDPPQALTGSHVTHTPAPVPDIDASMGAGNHQLSVADEIDDAKEEAEVTAQIEREAMRDVIMVDREPKEIEETDHATSSLSEPRPVVQPAGAAAVLAELNPAEQLPKSLTQTLECTPSPVLIAREEQEHAIEWETQLQEAAVEDNQNGVSGPLSSIQVKDDTEKDDVTGLLSIMEAVAVDTQNEDAAEDLAADVTLKRSKSTTSQSSSDTGKEAPPRKKPRNTSPSPSSDNLPDEPEPIIEDSKLATLLPAEPKRLTSRKSPKESKTTISKEDEILFEEDVRPAENEPAAFHRTKDIVPTPVQEDDFDMQEHFTDATNTPTANTPIAGSQTPTSVASTWSQRNPKYNVSHRELTALLSNLTPGMHFGLHLRSDSRPVRAKKSVDTPPQSSQVGDSFLIDEGMDYELEEEEDQPTPKKKRTTTGNTVKSKKTPSSDVKKLRTTASNGRDAPKAALGVKTEQKRRTYTQPQDVEGGEEEEPDLFPAPMIEKSVHEKTPTQAIPSPTLAKTEDGSEDELAEPSTPKPKRKATSTSTRSNLLKTATKGSNSRASTPALSVTSTGRPTPKNKFGFSPRAARAKKVGDAVAKLAATKAPRKAKPSSEGGVEAKDKSTVINNTGKANAASTVGAREPDRRVTRRSSAANIINLDTPIPPPNPEPTHTLAPGRKDSKTTLADPERRTSRRGSAIAPNFEVPRTRRASKQEERKKEEKEQNIGKRLRSKD